MKKNVTFKNRAINMAGNLYLPNDFSDNKKYAAIVCVLRAFMPENWQHMGL